MMLTEVSSVTKKIAILATDEFQDSELQVPYERLKDAGFKVLIVGPVQGKNITGKLGKYTAKTDLSVDSIRPDDFDALVIPGGGSPARLARSPASVDFVRAFGANGRPIAAICHAAQLLIAADMAKGRKMTCWPSVATEVREVGGRYVDEALVVDGNLISSRGPDDLPLFVDAIIAALEEGEEQLSA